MRDVGGLPNPDPTDTGSWSGEHIKTEEISVDEELEDSKPRLKRQAQNWAGFVYSLDDFFLSKIEARPLCNQRLAFGFSVLTQISEPYRDEEMLTPICL